MNDIKSILLIDDDQDDKYFFTKALEEVDESIQLFTASEGNDAFEKLRFRMPDLILLDLVMPGMNGAAFLKEIKNNPALSSIPVIIYTTSLSIFDETEVTNLGAYDIYIKPDNFEKTVETIQHILKSQGLKRSA